jgi:tetratricopeptide (TPR) repeat protein
MWLSTLHRWVRKKAVRPENVQRSLNSERALELADAWRFLDAKHWEEAALAAAPFLSSGNSCLRCEANKLVGLAHSKKGEPSAAIEHFLVAVEGSSQAADWYNLATAYTLAGDVELGQRAFALAMKFQERAGYSQRPSVLFMRLWYACALRDVHQYAFAYEQIEAIRPIYEQLHTTDATFLYIRGIPFLGHMVNVSLDVLQGLGPSFDKVTWIRQFASHLDSEGRTYLENAYQAFKERVAQP